MKEAGKEGKEERSSLRADITIPCYKITYSLFFPFFLSSLFFSSFLPHLHFLPLTQLRPGQVHSRLGVSNIYSSRQLDYLIRRVPTLDVVQNQWNETNAWDPEVKGTVLEPDTDMGWTGRGGWLKSIERERKGKGKEIQYQ